MTKSYQDKSDWPILGDAHGDVHFKQRVTKIDLMNPE